LLSMRLRQKKSLSEDIVDQLLQEVPVP